MKTLRLSTKIKKEIRYFSSLVLMLAASLCLLASLTSCSKETPSKDCGIKATVKDLRGLDGCGFVFELDNGEKLEPVLVQNSLLSCVAYPGDADLSDALATFELKDNQRVSIGYNELHDRGSICMVGKVVEINCIEEIGGMVGQ
jgi:hypothetical protein